MEKIQNARAIKYKLLNRSSRVIRILRLIALRGKAIFLITQQCVILCEYKMTKITFLRFPINIWKLCTCTHSCIEFFISNSKSMPKVCVPK